MSKSLRDLLLQFSAETMRGDVVRMAKPIAVGLRAGPDNTIGINTYIAWAEGVGLNDPTLSDLTPRLIDGFNTFTLEHVDPKTRAFVMASLSDFISWAVFRGLVTDDLARHIRTDQTNRSPSGEVIPLIKKGSDRRGS